MGNDLVLKRLFQYCVDTALASNFDVIDLQGARLGGCGARSLSVFVF